MAEETSKEEKSKEVDLTKYKVESVVNVIPLEPCIVWVAISDTEDEESPFRSIGVPGFYDSQSKKFVTLDGGRVKIEGFNEKLEDYIKQLDVKNTSQGFPSSQGE